MRRARRFIVSGCLLDQIFTNRPNDVDRALFKGVTSDTPEDMHITGMAEYDAVRDEWTFVCESAVFDELKEGEAPPFFTPCFTTHYDEASA